VRPSEFKRAVYPVGGTPRRDRAPRARWVRTLRRFLGGGWLPRVDPFVHRPRALL